MGLDNARKIMKDFKEEIWRIHCAKHNIKKAERNLDIKPIDISKDKIISEKNKDYVILPTPSNKPHQSRIHIYIGLGLVLLTLIVLSFVTLDTIVIETKTTTIRPVVNNHYTIQNINRTYTNIKAEHEMVCLSINNSEEMKCYKNVFR